MTNLAHATYRTIHSLKRKAAGEHALDTWLIADAFAEEWGLNESERMILSLRVMAFEKQLTTEPSE